MFGRGERIRTSDPLRPRQVRYQAALRPDCVERTATRGHKNLNTGKCRGSRSRGRLRPEAGCTIAPTGENC